MPHALGDLARTLARRGEDITTLQRQFSQAYSVGEMSPAAGACVKMQYLDKLLQEAEQIESRLIDR